MAHNSADCSTFGSLKEENMLTVKIRKYDRRSNERKWKSVEFKIVENRGGGDCLFMSLSEFISRLQTGAFYLDILHDQLRKKIVSHIVTPDQDDGTKFSTWNRYRQAIKCTLEQHVPFFRTYTTENQDPVLESQAREAYERYMSQTGTYGTYVEVCAAMELYGFNATLVEKTPGNANEYNVCRLERQRPHSTCGQRNSWIFLLFTGSLDRGHFELLEPIKSKVPLIPKGAYVAKKISGPSRVLCLTQKGDDTDRDSRSLTTHVNKSDGDVSSKRKSEEPLQLPTPKRLLLDIAETTQQQPCTSLLLPNELVTLHSEYVQELQNLRESFVSTFKLDTYEDDSDPSIWAGVKNSSILTLGRLRTAYLHFDPHSYTAMTPTNSSINFLIYDSGALQVTELDEEQNMVAYAAFKLEMSMTLR